MAWRSTAVLSMALSFGCSAQNDPGGTVPEVEVPAPAGPIAGGETTDFGDGARRTCEVIARTRVTVEEARERGHAIDEALALLARRLERPFHWGPADCSEEEPSLPGAQTTITLQVEQNDVEVLEETVKASVAHVTCDNTLSFRAIVGMSTADGLLRGRFYALFRGDAQRLCVHAFPDLRNFAGSFGMEADLARPHWGRMQVEFCLGGEPSLSTLSTRIAYTDAGAPIQQTERGGQWQSAAPEATIEPEANVRWSCGWPSAPLAPDVAPLTLNDYEGSPILPTVRASVRADAVSPAAPVAVAVAIDGAVREHSYLEPGTRIDLGDVQAGAVVRATVTNTHGAGHVRAHVLFEDYFRDSAECSEPSCTATAQSVVEFFQLED